MTTISKFFYWKSWLVIRILKGFIHSRSSKVCYGRIFRIKGTSTKHYYFKFIFYNTFTKQCGTCIQDRPLRSLNLAFFTKRKRICQFPLFSLQTTLICPTITVLSVFNFTYLLGFRGLLHVNILICEFYH